MNLINSAFVNFNCTDKLTAQLSEWYLIKTQEGKVYAQPKADRSAEGGTSRHKRYWIYCEEDINQLKISKE